MPLVTAHGLSLSGMIEELGDLVLQGGKMLGMKVNSGELAWRNGHLVVGE